MSESVVCCVGNKHVTTITTAFSRFVHKRRLATEGRILTSERPLLRRRYVERGSVLVYSGSACDWMSPVRLRMPGAGL